MLPRYPVYIPSKGRSYQCLTGKFLVDDGVPFFLVVEPAEFDVYAGFFGADRILRLPENDYGTSVPARNWIKAHATRAGFARHWQLDDNIYRMYRRHKGIKIACAAGIAVAAVEDFVDRYENIGVAGLNYHTFVHNRVMRPPFVTNVHVYSCTLVQNDLPYAWRSRYNDDTDMCLQVLAGGACTVLFNAFLIDKKQTMSMGGGNTDDLYQGDGRLKMARSLERLWPGVVTVRRRFKRPQHVINWRKFDTPLKLKADVAAADPGRYAMKLVQKKDDIDNPVIQQLLAEDAR